MLDLDAIEARAERYEEMLTEPEGDGSLVGRFFIIAKSLASDIPALVAELRAAREVVEAAQKLETDIESDLDWLHENLIAALAAYRAVGGPE